MPDATPAVEPPSAQAFFAALAIEISRPTYGETQRDYARALLVRAQEAGLYVPKETP